MYYKDEVLTVMASLRAAADRLETLTDAECWPYPTYGDLLFGVR
jgi:glutamine synthetase